MSKDSTRAAAARLKELGNAEISNNDMASLLLQAIKDNGTVVTQKLDMTDSNFRELSTKVTNLEAAQADFNTEQTRMNLAIQKLQDDMKKMNEFKENQIKRAKTAENKAVMAEYHTKKYNCILFNWPEVKAWESPVDSRQQLNIFLKDVLKIDNAEELKIANCHRLGTVNKDQKRPMIFRALFWDDREAILGKASKVLKTFNLANGTKYGISQQLPKRMQDNKDELWGEFKTARKNELKAKWKIDYSTAEYYLMVDGKEIRPKGVPKKNNQNSSTVTSDNTPAAD